METVHIVTDLGFGDAGKGTTVDYLARQAQSAVVVRYNGGAQAAHNVMTSDGRHHTFSQFGSGSFVEGVATHLSRYMMVNPGTMFAEADRLVELGMPDIWRRLTIDENAPIIMPWHRAANQLRELARGDSRHGSCGVGISEVQRDLLRDTTFVVRAGELRHPELLKARFRALQQEKLDQLRKELEVPNSTAADTAWGILGDKDLPDRLVDVYKRWLGTGLRIVSGSYLQDLSRQYDAMIFEGSQGVLLDEWYGFHPYTTWSTTTSENALQLLSEIDHSAVVTKLGILRAYTTRHGPGPFVTEDAGLAGVIPELHNGTGRWMGDFRYGHLDLVAHRYAIDATRGVDQLVVTGLDRSDAWRYADQYEPPTAPDLNTFFQLNQQGNVERIKVGMQGDLDHQARLTELLLASSPRYCHSGTIDSSQLINVIEDAYGVPVGIASYGPTAADKRVPVVV